MKLIINNPPPYGGKLIKNIDKKEHELKGVPFYDIKPEIDRKSGAPIRNVYREIISICYGFFSPLDRFMTREDVNSVLNQRRLPNGYIFPLPIIFDVDKEEIKKMQLREGDRLYLRLKGKPFAYIEVEEMWEFNPEEIAVKTFGTPEKNSDALKKPLDEKHPGFSIYRNMSGFAIAGKVYLTNEPKFKEPYSRFWYPPEMSREEFSRRNWRTVIAHQTRNVPHTGHEHLMKEAAFMGDVEPCRGILVNAIVGAKRIGDFVDEAILEGHEAVNRYGYIKPERHMVTFTLWDMRYGAPLESLLHGIIRQNMGCTHHMFGRDHAAAGDYFDPYSTQALWTKGLPSYGFDAPPYDVEKGLEIRPVNMQEFFYCPRCNEITYSETCGHNEAQRFSGSFVRGLIAEGIKPPSVIFRPEVYDVIVKWWRVFGYPFVNKRYLMQKEEELEVEVE
ncbi:MAG: sulfate adenylyltransferase [Nitrososphaeria archaeon]